MTSRAGGLFADPGTAGKHLAVLERLFIDSASRHSPAEFRAALDPRLEHAPDADLMLAQLVRFVEAVPTPATLLNDLLQYPPLLEVLLTVLGSSQYFTDILVRDPELFRWLTTSECLLRPLRREEFAVDVDRVLSMFVSPVRMVDSLKRLHRREMLRIGTRDLLGEADLVTVTRELSTLADGVIQAVFTVAAQQLSTLCPRPAATPYAVIGLGKLGGGELNYSSDIDLMVVYRDEGEFTDARGRRTTHQEYFVRLVEKAIRNLTEATAEGHLYRVDLRLRPEGDAGPLARSVGACLLYYEMRGELWERQMLIKARPAAGDLEFGREFVARLAPFVYPRTLLRSPVESITRMKARIEATIQEEENVKLGPGGIRDIEFTVQALQLLNGGKLPAVRSNNTLDAINHLDRAGLLTATEAGSLKEAYGFLRRVEHRLQMVQNVQTHSLPRHERQRLSLSKRLGKETTEELLLEYRGHAENVRGVFHQVLSLHPSPEELGLEAVLEGNINATAVDRFLREYGFRNLRTSSRALASLLRGESLTGPGTLDARLRDVIRSHAGSILTAVAGTPSPDLTLTNLASLADASALREVLYRDLADPGFRNLLIVLCARHPRWTRAVVTAPGLLEELPRLGEPSEDICLEAGTDWIAFKVARDLRAGARYALGLIPFDEFTADLSGTADTVLAGVYERQVKSHRMKNPPLAVFALGKYGTREITLDADLDLLFIGESGTMRRSSAMEKLAGNFVRTLSSVSETGRGYDIDTRLRPEGRNAPLVVESTAYLKYLQHRASLWERQSLTRLRFVCGNRGAGERILAAVLREVYSAALPPGWSSSVVDMRKKIEVRSRVRTGRFLDIKLGAGGMVDIEFVAQMLMLAAGPAGEEFHGRPTVDVLATIPSSAMTVDERRELSKTYRFFREIELLMRMVLEVGGSVIPDGEKLALLAQCEGGGGGAEFADRCAQEMRKVRRLFLHVAEQFQGS
jgi:[glutamine synthetase] adenylyltransferase / [glutamine synthetase]-adenylyl-L-tyrosine phosphorylase